MRFALLGALEVWSDAGTSIRIGAPMRRALIAALALEAGRPVSADRLIDELWGGEPPPAATESLHAQVSRLRRELGPERVQTLPTGYALRATDEEIDVRLFEAHLARARTLQRADRAAEALDELTAALGLWRGEPLAEFDGRDFAAAERARLDGLREGAREDRIDALLALGQHAQALPELEALVAEAPLSERPWSQLMLALYRAGRQADSLAVFQRLRRTLDEELGIEPSPELQDLQRRILLQDRGLGAPVHLRRAVVRIPVPPTGLIGRREELRRAVAVLGSGRLLTLTGPGGVGKTRLAIAVANAMLAANEDGVLFIDLSTVRDPAGVVGRIGEALGGGGDRPEAVVGDRQMLLVLDNFEQVIDAATDVARLLDACPRLRVLVTSRAPLRVSGEHRLDVPPLEPAEAAALFAERAQAAFVTASLPAPLVEEVVAHLDGLPLAVELAAAQISVLSAAALRDRLSKRLETLAAGPRDAPDRHRTLRETIAWSYDLLSPNGRVVFRKLSVLAGDFDVDAALAVGETDVAGLGELIDQSLVRRLDGRYRMLDSIQEFAFAEAGSAGEVDAARDRHMAHFVALTDEERMPRNPGETAAEAWTWFVRLERANLRSAFDWAISRGDDSAAWELFHTLGMYLVRTGAIEEGMAMSAQVLPVARRLGPRQELSALATASEFPRFGGQLRLGLERKLEALALARRVGSPHQLATTMDDAACIYGELGDFTRAETLLEEALTLRAAHVADDPLEPAHSWGTAAEVALRARRIDVAEKRMARVVELELAARPWPTWIVETEQLKARIDLAAGRLADARRRFERVAREGVDLEFRSMVAHALDGLATIEAPAEPARAAELLGMADRVRAEARSPVWDEAQRAQVLDALADTLGADELARLRASGHARPMASIPDRLAREAAV